MNKLGETEKYGLRKRRESRGHCRFCNETIVLTLRRNTEDFVSSKRR